MNSKYIKSNQHTFPVLFTKLTKVKYHTPLEKERKIYSNSKLHSTSKFQINISHKPLIVT